MKPGADLPGKEAGAADEYESALASLVTDPSPAAMNRFITKLDGEPGAALARAAVRSVCCGPVFRTFDAQIKAMRQRHPEATGMSPELELRLPELPVALLHDEAREALASPAEAARIPSRVVRLSTDTMLKQLANHSDLGAVDYRQLPNLLERGVTIARRRRSLSFFAAFNGRWYKAVVKRTEKDALYLVTYHRVDPGRLRSEIRRARLIRKTR